MFELPVVSGTTVSEVKMGTDITIHIEYKYQQECAWSYLTRFDTHMRHYGMFALMADARDVEGIEPLFVARGFPADKISAYNFDGINDYGVSWLTCDEFSRVVRATREQCGTVAFDAAVLMDILIALKKRGAVDSRIVFWFDS